MAKEKELTLNEQLEQLTNINRKMCLPEVLPCIDKRIRELREELRLECQD